MTPRSSGFGSGSGTPRASGNAATPRAGGGGYPGGGVTPGGSTPRLVELVALMFCEVALTIDCCAMHLSLITPGSMVELREVVPNRVLVVLPGWFFTIIISIWFLLSNLVCFAGRHQRAEGVTCGEMWQQTGEEVEVEEIDEEVDNMVVGKVARVREEIVGGREDIIALRTTTTSGDLLAAVEGLPWVGGEHLVGDQVIPLVLSN